MDMAFLSSIPLYQRYQSIARTRLAQRCTRRNISPSIRMSSSEVPTNSGNGLDFEEMAKRLAEELQSREVTEDASLEELAFRYAQKTQVDEPFDVELGKGEIPKVVMRHEPSQQEVEIYTYGACVTKWSIRGDDHLWLSDQNKWEQGGKPIRGGIPLCFPQFGPYGDLVQHGFGRISTWEIVDTLQNADGSVTTLMKLDSNCLQDEPAKWPHLFSAELAVTLSAVGLETKMSVKNIDNKPFSFTFAFHNYFKASRVQDARIFGFEGIRYNDRLDGDRECPAEEDSGAGLLLAKETDRIYLNAPEELALFDFASLKVLKIKKTPTLPNATLWNPFGAEGCDPGWENFVCVEPAVVTSPAVVQPGETWVGAQLLGIE